MKSTISRQESTVAVGLTASGGFIIFKASAGAELFVKCVPAVVERCRRSDAMTADDQPP